MSTITLDNKEVALAPLTYEDMESAERESELVCMATAEAAIARLHRLHIGTDADTMAILKTATDDIESGRAAARFLASSAGSAYMLWLSARHTSPMSLATFKAECLSVNGDKLKVLMDELLGTAPKKQAIRPERKYEQVEEQEDRRTRIFNTICETEKKTPAELLDIARNNIPLAVEWFCKYGAVKGCNPELLLTRIEEYVAKAR